MWLCWELGDRDGGEEGGVGAGIGAGVRVGVGAGAGGRKEGYPFQVLEAGGAAR